MRFKLIENRPMKVYARTLLTPRGMAKFDPGAWLAQFIMGTTKHCYIQNIEALDLLVSEKKFLFLVFPIVSLWRLSTPGAWPNLTQGYGWHNLCRGPLAIATYKISKLCALWFQRRRFLNFFPIASLLRLSTSGTWPNLTPGA